ncbi:hypothetical protein N3K66_001110 [Trichothecium roseum]|uniref:Uncharacterized protein n=1 Tax=Trichothecium roseum TaxID=47278 RepID=A0ACC0VFB7_9HYPO|nr:hypothetical protein N3K66_001110 [Trichothecium roseum]
MQRLLLLSRRATAATLPRSVTVTSAAASAASASSFNRPAPPKLPPSEQAEFERLQRDAAVSSAFQPSPDQQTPTQDASAKTSAAAPAAGSESESDVNVGMFRGAKPEFEGDTNPRTGEVGGPKNEPLRWGEAGDWSYNGRVTDF